MARGKIFINYRRDDSRADSGRLYDRLKARYPNRVFRDIGSLEPGVEWQEAIEKVLGSSDAVVVVIGKSWLTVTKSSGTRRLDDPKDTVRQEILTALRRGVRVFPVLVGGARMPSEEELPADLQSLARRNALEITEQDWDEASRNSQRRLTTPWAYGEGRRNSGAASGRVWLPLRFLARQSLQPSWSRFITQRRTRPCPSCAKTPALRKTPCLMLLTGRQQTERERSRMLAYAH